jgi:hypothetical protein
MMKYFIITIDTEGDNLWDYRLSGDVGNDTDVARSFVGQPVNCPFQLKKGSIHVHGNDI